MTSVEREVELEDRIRFNRPYACIDLDFRSCQEFLASVEHWDAPTIAWFDYTDRLDQDILSDIYTFVVNAPGGSLIIVTINCHPDTPKKSDIKDSEDSASARDGLVEMLRERVGGDNVPEDITENSLISADGTAEAQERIVNVIQHALSNRNGSCDVEMMYQYLQLVNFRYRDGLKMQTIGGLVYQEKQSQLVEQCRFEERLDFVRKGRDYFRVEVPFLTPREKMRLDEELPLAVDKDLMIKGIPGEQIARYRALYRYFPNFIVGE